MSEERFDFRSAWGLPTKSDPDFELSDLDPEVPEGGNPQATQGGPERQKFVEFYNPAENLFRDEDDAGWYYGKPDHVSVFPGIRFPQVATIAEQDVGNFLTIPANIAAERLALGGDLVSWSNGYTATDKDIADVMQRTGLEWNDRAVNKLMASTSPEDLEAQAIVYARRQQREEQIIADNPGLTGFGLRILVNIGDPTFIAAGAATGPVIAARIANSATKTGAAIRFAAEGMTKGERFKVGALTALAVDVPIEAANLAADPARDPLMTAGFLAFTPILGGALNQLGRTKSDLLMDALKDLDEKVAAGIKGTDGGAMGAAQSGSVPRLAPEDDIPGAPAREGKLTFGTPLNFLARSADPLTRSLSSKLSWNPWTNRKGNGAQSGTAAEAQRRMYNAQSTRIRVMRTAAKKYFQTKGLSPRTDQIEEFMTEVGQVLTGVRRSDDPNILAAVEEVREGFADALAMVKDRDYIPGGVMDRPTTVRPKDPPDGGSSPTPARASQDAEPTSAPSSETPEVPEVAATPVAETPQPNPYFGRKSFRGGEAAPAAPEAGPAAAPAAAPEAPPVQTRTQMGSRLKELRRAAEAFIVPTEAEGDLAKALQQIDRVVKGVALGSPDAFQARYVDALERLARALEDEPFAEDILADVLGELDSRPNTRASFDVGGQTEKLRNEKGAVVDPAQKEAARAAGFDADTVWYHGTTQDFDSFDGLTFLTSSPYEASAYGNLGFKARADLADYKGSAAGRIFPGDDLVGLRVPYAGIISDIHPSERQGVWATDQGVVRFNEDGSFDFAENALPDYKSEIEWREDGSGLLTLKARGDGDSNLARQYFDNRIGDKQLRVDRLNASGLGDNNQVLTVFAKDGKFVELEPMEANILGKRLQNALSPDMQKRLDDLMARVEQWKAEGYVGIRTSSDEGAMMGETIPQLVIFEPKDIRSVNAKFDPGAADSSNLLASVDIDEAASAARRKEAAAIYDNTLAEREFLGKGKAPLGPTASAAIGGTAGIGALSMAAWLADADDDTVAAAGAFGAALGVALGAVTGKARLRSWEVNSPGIAIFLGPESPGANKKLLAKASEMEARGTDRDVIWKETGWGRGPSGGWVYEADEPMGELIDDLLGENIPIPEALKGKRLFEAEPELRSVLLQTRQLLAEMKELGDETGMFVEGLASDVGEIAVNRNLSRADKLRILIHELNHAGQTKRGMGFGDETTSDLRTYLTNAAEAESRLAEARMGLSRKERLNRPPWKDYDVPEDDLWSATTTARAASLGSDLRRFRDDAWFDQNVKQGTFEDGELAGYQYYRSDEAGVTAWVEDLGDGEGSWNWDWNENLDNGTIFSDNPNASPAQSARAFAFAQASFERLTAGGKFDVLTFEGLKKPTKEGQAASGHERVQEFLMARGNTPGYVPSKGSWKTKVKDPETGEMIEVTRSSFAFSKEGMDLDEVWQGIRRGKVEVTPIEQAKPKVAASRRYENPNAESRAAQPADEYTGLDDARFIDYDPAYLPRRFSQKGWQRVISSPQFRNNTPKLGARIGEVIYRTNPKGMDELAAARPTPISGQDLALRMGKQYVNTVADLMSGQSGPKFRKVSMDSREAAKEAVRESLAKGDLMGFETEDAMELLLDLIAPIRKNSAEVKNFRPRVDMKLDAELDADFIDMFEWNAESLFMEYSRTMSGYAGLLRSGFRSEAELDRQINDIIERSKFDPKRKDRAKKEAQNLKLLKQSILGQPEEDLMNHPEWTWLANQMRRLNFGNLMNNTGFLAISEALGAVNQVGIARMFTMFPEFQRYYKLARAGDPAARDNIFYLADATMGHGAAQVRSRLGQTNRFDVEENSIRDELQGVKGEIDKFTRKQANLVGRLSGMAPMQEYFRMVIVTAEAQDWVKAARKGKPIYSANRMRAMGVDEAMWQRVSTQLRKWGDTQSPDTRRSLPEMDLNVWDDKEALNAWINALDRNANRLVMEGDAGHIPFWLRNRPAAQLIFQFLNFPINAFSKHMGFAIKTADARAAGEFLTMSLGGAVGVMARIQATAWAMDTEEERKAYLEERFTLGEFGKALMYYNAHSSLAPNILDLGLYTAGVAGVPNPVPGFEGQTVKPLFTSTRGSGIPVSSNPSMTRIERTPKVLGALTTGTPFSEQDVAGVVKHFSPLGNHIAMNALLDRIFEFLPDEEGSVEDQVQN